MERLLCRACGAAMTEDAVWCPQCYRRPVSDEAAAALVAEVDRLSVPQMWEPPRAFRDPPRAQSVWSRRFRGATSFGLRGRVLMTAGIAGLFLFGGLQLGISTNGGPFTMLYVGFTLPGIVLLLHDIWKRERNVIPLPMRECRVCRESMCESSERCPRCKAAV